jgi:FkbM family methyltransferase
LLLRFGYEKINSYQHKKTSLKSLFKIFSGKILTCSGKKSPNQESSPLKDGHHAVTESFFDTLLKLNYAPQHIVDVGANRGNWTRTAVKYFPQARFTMFEPQEKMRQEVADLLTLPGIEFHCMGAGPVNSTMHLSQHDRDDSHTFALTSQQAMDFGYPQIKVPVVALDEFFKGKGMPKVDILKIDAEGWDLEVLKGARRTAEAAGIVLMEASILNPLFPNTAEEVIGAMSRLGFSLFDITDLNRTTRDGALWLVEFAFVKRDGPLRKAVMSYA